MSQAETQVPFVAESYWLRFLSRAVEVECKSDPKRNSRRYPFYGDVKLIFGPEDDTRTRSLSFINISADGITLKGSSEMPVDSRVVIQLNPEGSWFALAGRVIHCTGTLGGFKIGITLEFCDEDAAETLEESN